MCNNAWRSAQSLLVLCLLTPIVTLTFIYKWINPHFNYRNMPLENSLMFNHFEALELKYMEKSLRSKSLTRTNRKTSHTS